MTMNVFNSSGTAYLGPQPAPLIARKCSRVSRPRMITFPTTRALLFRPGCQPTSTVRRCRQPAHRTRSFSCQTHGTYRVYHFHADFADPDQLHLHASSASSPAAGFTELFSSAFPQLGGSNGLDNLADRLMFRLAYRNFGDHESLVGNFTVRSNNVAGIRWFELRGVTSGSGHDLPGQHLSAGHHLALDGQCRDG